MVYPVLFARHAPPREKPMQPANRDCEPLLGQGKAQFFKRDVLAPFPKGENVGRSLLDTARAHVSAFEAWRQRSRFRAAAHATGSPWMGPSRIAPLLPGNSAAFNRSQKPNPQIHREIVSHPCRSLSPAWLLDQKSRGEVILHRLKAVENRSKRILANFIESNMQLMLLPPQ